MTRRTLHRLRPVMPQKRLLTLVVLLAVTLLAALAIAQSDEEQASIEVEYHGELLDENNAPISGIFPLAFRMYNSETSERPVWSERQYVSVHLGEYTVQLGSEAPISPQMEGKKVYLAVEIEGIGEIVRHPLTVNSTVPAGPNAPDVAKIETLEFAQVADRALLAERARVADDCERLGGLTVEELNRYDELERQIQQLRQQLQSKESGGGVTIGSRTITLEAAGGSGGARYNYTCPPGHVAVGMTGGSGNLLDSLALICAPLE